MVEEQQMKGAQTYSTGYETCLEPAVADRRGQGHHRGSAWVEGTHGCVQGSQERGVQDSGWTAAVHMSDHSSHCTDQVLVAAYHTCPAVVKLLDIIQIRTI
jgi:hypothetical protein